VFSLIIEQNAMKKIKGSGTVSDLLFLTPFCVPTAY